MKRFIGLVAITCCTLLSPIGYAQDHYTEGNVREVSFYRTKPGQFDEYMKFLRSNFLPLSEELKKQGLIVDFRVMVKTPHDMSDWDVAVVTIHRSYGAALDFNQGDEDKSKAIQANHYKTTDEKKQREMAARRFDMRTYLGTEYIREVNLRPLQ
jgi:hypothetical protein